METPCAISRLKKPRVTPYSCGFVSVPVEDVELKFGGYLPGFVHDGRYYCYHADHSQMGRIIYRDVSEE